MRVMWFVAVSILMFTTVSVAAAQAPMSAGYVTVDSSRIYYTECGTGPVIVLLHDGLTGASGWSAVWPGLCTKFHVLRYDRRGMGRSDPPKAPFSPTADLAALLADRHIKSATIVGSSAGGGLAIDFALRYPHAVQRLVLLGPVLNGMGFSDHFLERERANMSPLAQGDVRATATKQANDRYVLAPNHTAARDTLLAIILANPQNLRKRGDLELPLPLVAAARLGEVHVPTLILVGEYDIPDVQSHAGAIEFGIWGARREVVRDAGHLLQLDQPTLLMNRIIAFVAESPIAYVSTEQLQAYVGTFSPLARDQAGSFYVRDGRLVVHFPPGRDIPLYPSSDSTFYTLVGSRPKVAFHRDATGKVIEADISINGATHSAARVNGAIPNAPWSATRPDSTASPHPPAQHTPH